MSGQQASGEPEQPRPAAPPPAAPPSDAVPPGTGPRPLSAPGTARVAALDALLRDIDDLRRTLETDLTLAAGAVESEAPDLAASLLASDRAELARFQQRALQRLRTLEEADGLEDLHDDLDAGVYRAALAPVAPRRRSRLARLLPAAPMVAAAAALVGFLGVVPSGSSRPATTDVSGAVLSSWAELERLTSSDAPPEQVQRAARDLNAVIASMVARADGDPEAARRALELLREAELVLSADDDAAQLQQVLQQSRDLAARLLASLPPAPAPSQGIAEAGAVAPPAVPLPAPAGDAVPQAPSVARSPGRGAPPSAAARRSPRPDVGAARATPGARASARSTSDAARASARPTAEAAREATRAPRRGQDGRGEATPAPRTPRPSTASTADGSSPGPASGRPTTLPGPVIDPV